MKPVALVLRPVLVTIVLVSLVALPALAGEPAGPGNAASAKSAPPDVAEVLAHPDVRATTSVVVCTPNYIGTFATRVHVECTTGTTVGSYTIWYWAVSSANQAAAARALSLFLTAKATGKNLRIYYDGTDTSGTSVGCGINNCRLAWGIELAP